MTVRSFLAIGAMKNLELKQMDIHKDFLHGDFDWLVSIKFSPDFTSLDPGRINRIRKSIYGLRQLRR